MWAFAGLGFRGFLVLGQFENKEYRISILGVRWGDPSLGHTFTARYQGVSLFP